MNSKSIIFYVFLVSGIILISCNKKQITDGPYFGNGFHNGWADQTSVVIWTRLTQNPEMNVNGKKFLQVTNKQHQHPDLQIFSPSHCFIPVLIGWKLFYIKNL